MIRQAFIRQMPVSLGYSTRQCFTGKFGCFGFALASENDVEEKKHGVAGFQVSESAKLVGLLEDLSRRLKKLETATAKKKNYGHKQTTEHRDSKKSVLPNVQAKPFIPSSSNDNRQGFNPPPNLQQNNASQLTDTVNVQVC